MSLAGRRFDHRSAASATALGLPMVANELVKGFCCKPFKVPHVTL